ncbi:MAG: rRNA maturation RNase YbeY [Pirellulaceae bacterium]
MIEIEIADQQTTVSVDRARLARAARAILQDHGPRTCRISIALVDDATIQTLNRQYLQHDYATDVLSFVLEETPDLLEGEIIVSGETAAAQAGEYDGTPAEELLLYVIHGILHLVGFDDQAEPAREEMRCAEAGYLKQSRVEHAE